MSRNFVRASEALHNLLNRQGLAHLILESKLRKQWVELLGEKAAAMAELDSLKDGKMCIRVEHSVWRMELNFQRDNLRAKANALLGGEVVKEVILR